MTCTELRRWTNSHRSIQFYTTSRLHRVIVGDLFSQLFLKSHRYLFTTCDCLSTSASLSAVLFLWHQRQPSSHTVIWLDSLCQIKEQQPWAGCQAGMLQDILDKYYNAPQSSGSACVEGANVTDGGEFRLLVCQIKRIHIWGNKQDNKNVYTCMCAWCVWVNG